MYTRTTSPGETMRDISYFHEFPEGSETIIRLGDHEGMLKVTRTGDTLRFRLRNSFSLTEINLQLTLQIPHYSPLAFNQSFTWATIDEASGIDIRMSDGFEPRDKEDFIFIYLATVFGSYIGHGEDIDARCASIIMSLRGTGIIINGQQVQRFLEICKLSGRSFREVGSPERLIQRGAQQVEAVITPPSQASELEALPSGVSAGTGKSTQVVETAVETIGVRTERLIGQAHAQIRDPSQGIELFIKGLEGKSPTRAIKLLENAIAENRFGEEGIARLQRLLDERNHKALQASDPSGNRAPNPKEFIDALTGSLRNQIEQIERQIKKGKRHGEVYIKTLVSHKTSLESRLAGRR